MLIFCFVLASGYLLQSVQFYFYAVQKGRRAVKFEQFMDIFDIILILIWFALDLKVIYEPSEVNNFFYISLCLAGITGIQWIRAILAFSVNRFFTPLIMILGLMLTDLLKFLILLGLSFFLWCCVGNILLNEMDEYSSVGESIITLFGASLGDFDMRSFEAIDYPIIGQLFLGLYMIFMMITLLNFIIAIMSDTYANNTENSTAIYLREVILLDSKLGHEKRDNCRTWKVSAIVPFNIVLHFVAIPMFLFSSDDSKRGVTQTLLRICFIPFYVFGVLWNIVFGFLYIGYLVISLYFERIGELIFGTKHKKPTASEVLKGFGLILLFVIIVPLAILYYLAVNTYKEIPLLFKKNKISLERRISKQNFRYLTPRELEKINSVLTELQKKYNAKQNLTYFVPCKIVISEFQKKLDNINSVITKILKPILLGQPVMENIDSYSGFYNFIKRFIWSNSVDLIPYGEEEGDLEKCVNLTALLTIIKEMKGRLEMLQFMNTNEGEQTQDGSPDDQRERVQRLFYRETQKYDKIGKQIELYSSSDIYSVLVDISNTNAHILDMALS